MPKGGIKGQHAKPARNTVRNIVSADNHNAALQLRLQGMTYRQIGETLGIHRQAAFRLVDEEFKAIKTECYENAEQLRTIQHARLERLMTEQYAIATTNDPAIITALHNLNVDERIELLDALFTRRGEAMDRCIRGMAREAKLMGLDAPERIAGPGGGIQIIIPESLKGILEGEVKTTGEGVDASGDTRD